MNIEGKTIQLVVNSAPFFLRYAAFDLAEDFIVEL